MEYKSNITIASNIYPRKNSHVKHDSNFIANIHSDVALRELKRRLYGDVELNDVQRNI